MPRDYDDDYEDDEFDDENDIDVEDRDVYTIYPPNLDRISERNVENYLYLDDMLDDLDRNPPGAGKSGCFIATAAYGSYAEHNVLILREFRDNVLQHSIPGRLFIRCYYRTSPPIARFIASREFLKKIVRIILKPIVCFVSPATAGNSQ